VQFQLLRQQASPSVDELMRYRQGEAIDESWKRCSTVLLAVHISHAV